MARLHVLWELCGINDSARLEGVCLLQYVGVEGCIFLVVVWAGFASFFLIILFKLAGTVDQCPPVKHVVLCPLPFFFFLWVMVCSISQPPPPAKLWCFPAYFIAPVMLVWRYIRISVVMSTLHSPRSFSLANLSFVLTQRINHSAWRKLHVLI